MAITYNILTQEKKPWGVDIAVAFYDDETETTITKTFRFDNFLTEPKLSEIMNHAIYNIKFNLNFLNEIDLGENFEEVLVDLVKYIRNHNDCTLAQLKTAIEIAYPDLFWKVDKLIDRIKAQLQNHLKITITFIEFKAYVINHSFRGVD